MVEGLTGFEPRASLSRNGISIRQARKGIKADKEWHKRRQGKVQTQARKGTKEEGKIQRQARKGTSTRPAGNENQNLRLR